MEKLNIRLKELEVTDLISLKDTVHDCEDLWKKQDRVLGKKVYLPSLV